MFTKGEFCQYLRGVLQVLIPSIFFDKNNQSLRFVQNSMSPHKEPVVITIAIIDTGVDLSQRYISDLVHRGANFIDERNPPNDDM